MQTANSLVHYRLLGRSGMRVSPMALGTMTFGTEWGWGSDDAQARRIFDTYVDRGGNFIDTAVNYTGGASERMLGALMKGRRDRLVLATKFTMARDHGDPNSGGNHRMNMMRSVEDSLRQLDTDRLELLYLHGWDFTTAPDEVMRGLDDLVRGGKVLYIGICNTPAWQVARMQTLADLRGWTPLVALQIEYSLIERTVEHELIPMAAALGLGVLPWSPLGGGMLSGKYSQGDLAIEADAGVSASRKGVIVASGHMTARALSIADTVTAIAGEVGATASQVAIAWLLARKSVTAPVVGARTVEQLIENLGALDVSLRDEHLLQLDQASAPPATFPDRFMSTPMLRHLIFGGAHVQGRE